MFWKNGSHRSHNQSHFVVVEPWRVMMVKQGSKIDSHWVGTWAWITTKLLTLSRGVLTLSQSHVFNKVVIVSVVCWDTRESNMEIMLRRIIIIEHGGQSLLKWIHTQNQCQGDGSLTDWWWWQESNDYCNPSEIRIMTWSQKGCLLVPIHRNDNVLLCEDIGVGQPPGEWLIASERQVRLRNNTTAYRLPEFLKEICIHQ